VLKVVDLKPFNDTWQKKRSVGNYRHRRNLIGNVPMIQLDEHQKYLIRKTVHSFFSANRIPTIDAVYKEVQNNEEIPNISRSKLYNILHELKFK
jgi:hypothetical protein